MLNSMEEGDVGRVLRKSIEIMKHRSRSASPTPDRDSAPETYLDSLRKLFD
jgi:hypothetical protein